MAEKTPAAEQPYLAEEYWWQVTVRDGAFYADGAPTAGPPPYELYEVIPTTAFGFAVGSERGGACRQCPRGAPTSGRRAPTTPSPG
jgi:hypothetical protein